MSEPKPPRVPVRPSPLPGGMAAGTRRQISLDRTEIDVPGATAVPVPLGRELTPPPVPKAAAAPKLNLAPGMRIEQYELIRELGRGGMGQVYLARDTRLGRRVAMKFLITSSPKFTERFLVEARATARCSHENIVVIHDVESYQGLPYMVLEFVEGHTLTQLMSEKRLPVGRAIELIVPVVKALARAHEMNIIHRDLKPANIVVTAGTVKVLDFGIAKMFDKGSDDGGELGQRRRPPTPGNAVLGTLPYMSPEQLGTDEVDHRSDLWAVGIILYEMLAGKHPLDPVTQGRLFGAASALDEPMPSIADDVAGLPVRLAQVVARCLAKRKGDRYGSAAELLADLEPLLPSRAGRNLASDESPFPGLNAFQEADANRFFGRSQEIASVVSRLRDQPLVAVVGPSGVGKSSFVRAGVGPALKASGEPWEVVVVRPGRHPMAALVGSLEQMRDSRDSDPVIDRTALPFGSAAGQGQAPPAAQNPAARLRAEPGVYGARLRARAQKRRTQILLFVDQHEELYTQVADPAERLAFTACLRAAGDDPSGPLRVLVSMRSDFLDRAAEDRQFVEELSKSLVFLQPPNRAGLEEALVQPLEMLGYAFEPGIVPAMLDALAATPGSLPLLQFTAAKLWDTRDRTRRVLTGDSYHTMGGIAGALATHADQVIGGMADSDQRLVRAIFQRLVTPERTRAVVDAADLREISPETDRIVALLVGARLLVMHRRGVGDRDAGVELVHESLIKSWPTLARWLDEIHDDAAFLAQLSAAAKQWDNKGRVEGLLWRNEAMDEARLWWSRSKRELPERDKAYLDAVFALARRATRVRRGVVIGAFVVLLGIVAAGSVALLQIRAAEKIAQDKAVEAQHEQARATAAAKTANDEAAAKNDALLIVQKQSADLEQKRAELAEELAAIEAQKTQIKSASVALVQAKSATQQALDDKRAQAAAAAKAAAKLQHQGQFTTDLK